jgi:hypothetical protein
MKKLTDKRLKEIKKQVENDDLLPFIEFLLEDKTVYDFTNEEHKLINENFWELF